MEDLPIYFAEQINGLVCIYDRDLLHERINTSQFPDNGQDRSNKNDFNNIRARSGRTLTRILTPSFFKL